MPHPGHGSTHMTNIRTTNIRKADIRKVCVYCGSSPGTDSAFVAAATRLGKLLADSAVGLVYGGGSPGLMGALARSVTQNGGDVTGIIPEFLKTKERLFADAKEVIVTRDMHERKRLMFERADAFVALPGGIGTLEELVEQLTWAQLGRHRKPIAIVNINGFWDGLIEVFGHMNRRGFIHNGGLLGYKVVDSVEDVLPALFEMSAGVPEDSKSGELETVRRL
jgi:uncharacterized protein (TIGR00730 family)